MAVERSATPRVDHPVARVRIIVDPDGRPWTVRELGAPDYDRRMGASLVFVSDDAMRRVRHYPANWFDLTDSALYDVSLRT